MPLGHSLVGWAKNFLTLACNKNLKMFISQIVHTIQWFLHILDAANIFCPKPLSARMGCIICKKNKRNFFFSLGWGERKYLYQTNPFQYFRGGGLKNYTWVPTLQRGKTRYYSTSSTYSHDWQCSLQPFTSSLPNNGPCQFHKLYPELCVCVCGGICN